MSRPRSTRTAACWVSSRSRRRRRVTRELHGWLAGFGPVDRVGVEGTGAYGAGLARHLRGEGLVVIEVDRPNRQERRRNGKSDELDAIEAARAALSGRASGIAKSADGDVEAIRALLVARRSGRNVRIKYLNQIRHLGFTAPDELRERLRDVPADQLARTAAALRPTAGQRHRRVRDETRDRDAGTSRRSRSKPTPSVSTTYSTRLVRRTRAEPARGLRRRDPHRRDLVGRRRRQPAPAEKRSRVRASVWRRTPARVVGQDPATSSAQPRREPPSEPCPVADRVHPHERR